MKAILEFNLPEDASEHLAAVHALDLKSVLWDFTQQLRTWERHCCQFKTVEEAIEGVKKEFWELIDSHGVRPILE